MLQILLRSFPPSLLPKKKGILSANCHSFIRETPIDCRHTWPVTKLEWQTGRFGHGEFVFFSFVDRLVIVDTTAASLCILSVNSILARCVAL